MSKEIRSVVMEGDLVEVRRTTVERQVKAADFINELNRSQPLDSGFLPHGCVHYTRIPDNPNAGIKRPITLYTLERPAAPYVMQYRKRPETRDEEINPDTCIKEYQLSFPTTLWILRFHDNSFTDLYLVSTKASLAVDGMKTKVFYLPTPNQYDQGNFCVGNLAMNLNEPPAARCERLMDYLMKSLWNADLNPDFTNAGIGSLRDWHDQTAKDKDFYKKLTLQPAINGETYAQIIAFLTRQS